MYMYRYLKGETVLRFSHAHVHASSLPRRGEAQVPGVETGMEPNQKAAVPGRSNCLGKEHLPQPGDQEGNL